MKKILIVDDATFMQKVTSAMLSHKYETICASSGEEAIALYEREKPDMILTDLIMPRMTGLELQKILQERYAQPEEGGLRAGEEGFRNVYRYVVRSLENYHGTAELARFTLDAPGAGQGEAADQFGEVFERLPAQKRRLREKRQEPASGPAVRDGRGEWGTDPQPGGGAMEKDGDGRPGRLGGHGPQGLKHTSKHAAPLRRGACLPAGEQSGGEGRKSNYGKATA